MRKTIVIGATGFLLLALTACSSVKREAGEAAPAGSASPAVTSSGSPASTGSQAGSPSKAPAKSSTTSVRETKPATSVVLVPMQTSHGGEFRSPTGNITCEVDLTQVYCQTGTPARSVTMSKSGSYTTCKGQQCLGDAGDGTPTLQYGQATGVGPFRCESADTGVTCKAGAKGFRIANAGVTSVAS